MIETGRLILRAWRDEDVPLHNAMCNDAAFMRFLGPPLPMAESAAAAARQNANFASYGSCFWAVERRGGGEFVGYCGIKPGPDDTPIAGLPEIGWGIAPDHWHRGYAREAASACLDWAWANTGWDAVVAITSAINLPSIGVMTAIGMARVADGDFDHPAVPVGSAIRRHVLYRIDRPAA